MRLFPECPVKQLSRCCSNEFCGFVATHLYVISVGWVSFTIVFSLQRGQETNCFFSSQFGTRLCFMSTACIVWLSKNAALALPSPEKWVHSGPVPGGMSPRGLWRWSQQVPGFNETNSCLHGIHGLPIQPGWPCCFALGFRKGDESAGAERWKHRSLRNGEGPLVSTGSGYYFG